MHACVHAVIHAYMHADICTPFSALEAFLFEFSTLARLLSAVTTRSAPLKAFLASVFPHMLFTELSTYRLFTMFFVFYGFYVVWLSREYSTTCKAHLGFSSGFRSAPFRTHDLQRASKGPYGFRWSAYLFYRTMKNDCFICFS